MSSGNWETLYWLFGCREGLGMGWIGLPRDTQEECVSLPFVQGPGPV